MRTILHNFTIASLSRLLVGGIGLIIIGLMTRALGPAGFGDYSLILALLFVFTTLADLGLYSILVREISREEDQAKIVSNIFTLRLFAVLIFALLAIILVWALPYTRIVKIGVVIASIYTILSSLSQVLLGLFQRHLKLHQVSVADVVTKIIQLGLVFIVLRIDGGITQFIWATVFSELIRFCLIFGLAKRMVPIKLDFNFNYWKKILKSSLPIAASLIFVLLYFKLDTIILSLMKPAYDVGIYSAPYRILEVIIFFPAAYLGLIMPLLSKQAIENLNDFKKIFQKTFNVLAIFAIPLTAFLLLRAGDIVGIINGVGFEDSAPVLSILSVAIALIFFGNLGGNALIALDLQKKGVWFYFSGALLNISVNLIFIPKFSYLATAWSTVATELLITLGIFALIYKETKILPNVAALIKPIVVTILVAAVLRPFGLPFWWAAFLSLAYFPLLYLFRGFRMRDFAEIISKTI